VHRLALDQLPGLRRRQARHRRRRTRRSARRVWADSGADPVPHGPGGTLMVVLDIGLTGSIPGDIAQAGVSALASFFGDFVSGFVKWAMAGVAHAMTATTDLSLTSGWLQGPWASMVNVAGVLAVPLVLARVVQVVVRGAGPG